MGPMSKTLSEYRSTLGEVLRYEPTDEFTKKLLTALGLEWREEVKWSLPLRVGFPGGQTIKGGYIEDADGQLVVDFGDDSWLPGHSLRGLQRILTAANAELSRQVPTPLPPYWRQGDNPK
jgi:hypothetical protein